MTRFFKDETKTPQEAAKRVRKLNHVLAGAGIAVLAVISIALQGASLDRVILLVGLGGFSITTIAVLISNYASECQLKFMGWKPPEKDGAE